jgi:hypothetical protein
VLSVKRVDRAIIDPIDRVARARFIFGPNAGLTVLLRYVEDDAKQITYDAKIVVGPDVAFHQPIFVAIDADPNAPADARRYDAGFGIALAWAIADIRDALAGGPHRNDATMHGGTLSLAARLNAVIVAYSALPPAGRRYTAHMWCATPSCRMHGRAFTAVSYVAADTIVYNGVPPATCRHCEQPGTPQAPHRAAA